MYVDSHCHLSFPALVEQLPAIRLAMAEAQVDRALCICTTLEEFDDVHGLALAYDNFFATVGVHPDNEASDTLREPTLDDLLQRAQSPKVVGIGETGLDYFRLNGRTVADMAWQRERFRIHIRAAQQTTKPLIIHTRSASDDTIALLREMGEDGSVGAAGGVFHCFTETEAVARAALDLGFAQRQGGPGPDPDRGEHRQAQPRGEAEGIRLLRGHDRVRDHRSMEEIAEIAEASQLVGRHHGVPTEEDPRRDAHRSEEVRIGDLVAKAAGPSQRPHGSTRSWTSRVRSTGS